MLKPLIGLVLGIPILLYGVLGYTGSPFLKNLVPKKQKGNAIFAIGYILIAISLILGTVGYFSNLNVTLLRYVRLLSGTFGFVGVGYQIGKIWLTNDNIKALKIKSSSKAKELRRYTELLHVLVSRNLKVRYRGSFLGIYWSLVSPLIMTGVYTAIFGVTFASYYNNSIINYISAAFTGLVVINFFSASTSQALTSIVANGSLMNKIRLPISVFPMSMIVANIFQLVVGILPVLIVITVINSKNLINVFALLLPLLALVLVCAGIGFIVSAMFVLFRDLNYFYELVVFLLWISSPIFYPAAIVPKEVKPIIALNPLVSIVESLRQITLSGNLADINLIFGALLSGVIMMILGWLCFRYLQPQFMDLL
jgi:lipopolysaccharide transport system permease protein